MKLPSPIEFNFKDCVIAGDECWLITPKDMATKWSDENSRFRSCIVRKDDNHVISQGFGKFTNFGEQPAFQPWDKSWSIEARHKLDGSLLIVSIHKDVVVARTRGTIDASQLPNGAELEVLKQKYPVVFCSDEMNHSYSYLYEWTTPTNVIVLREHNEPTLTLIGIVDNETCTYSSNCVLDWYANVIGVERPTKYEYSSVEDCILDVNAWRGKEGVVLYSPDGQTLKKIKASEYCQLHKIATGLKTVKHVMDMFIASPRFTEYKDFYNYVEVMFDFEIAEKIKDDIAVIVQAYTNYLTKLDSLRKFVKELSYYETRREQAICITSKYSDWRKSYAFNLLDNRECTPSFESAAIHHELEKLTKN
jgi:hypothetical protein